MNGKELFERWTSVHALRYFEKYEDREITDQRIFEYIDTSKSNVLNYLLDTYSIDQIINEFRNALLDFQ
jgi:hypothetical protein